MISWSPAMTILCITVRSLDVDLQHPCIRIIGMITLFWGQALCRRQLQGAANWTVASGDPSPNLVLATWLRLSLRSESCRSVTSTKAFGGNLMENWLRFGFAWCTSTKGSSKVLFLDQGLCRRPASLPPATIDIPYSVTEDQPPSILRVLRLLDRGSHRS